MPPTLMPVEDAEVFDHTVRPSERSAFWRHGR
jgi:hypothetical protein